MIELEDDGIDVEKAKDELYSTKPNISGTLPVYLGDLYPSCFLTV